MQALKEISFDEVFDSQKIFRILLDAMSRPGRAYQLPVHSFAGTPANLCPYVLSVLKTLCDWTVSFAATGQDAALWQEYLELNTGCPVRPAEEADYVIFPGSVYCPEFAALKRGRAEFPQESATALILVNKIRAIEVENLSEAGKNNFPKEKECRVLLVLSGPGIEKKHYLCLEGLTEQYIHSFKEMAVSFPLGIDAVFLDNSGQVACLARTTKAEVI